MNGSIIVFDSGVGGLSILHEIDRQQLNFPLIYLADQANFPYGDRSPIWISNRLTEVAAWAVSYNPSAFVLACNSGTVSGITAMRSILSCPVIGVEPVIKPLSSYNKSMILATSVTANSDRTKELLTQFGSNTQVIAAHGLAAAIENNDNEQVKTILKHIAEKAKRERVEAIGLSCTHYPLIADQLIGLLPNVDLYDPAEAVVRELQKQLGTKEVSRQAVERKFLTTGGVVRFKEQLAHYLGINVEVERVSI